MTGRSFGAFNLTIHGLDNKLLGANCMDVAGIGIDLALLTQNSSLLTAAYQRVHSDLQIQNGTEVDGIRLDGSFGLWILKRITYL